MQPWMQPWIRSGYHGDSHKGDPPTNSWEKDSPLELVVVVVVVVVFFRPEHIVTIGVINPHVCWLNELNPTCLLLVSPRLLLHQIFRGQRSNPYPCAGLQLGLSWLITFYNCWLPMVYGKIYGKYITTNFKKGFVRCCNMF